MKRRDAFEIDVWDLIVNHMLKKGFLVKPSKDGVHILTEEGKGYLTECLRKLDKKEEN